jgi:hypothetical protein
VPLHFLDLIGTQLETVYDGRAYISASSALIKFSSKQSSSTYLYQVAAASSFQLDRAHLASESGFFKFGRSPPMHVVALR